MSRSFDQRLNLELENLDARMDHSDHGIDLVLPDGAGTLSFNDHSYAIDTLEASEIPAPALSGALEEARLNAFAAVESADGGLAQFAFIKGVVDPNAALTAALPDAIDVAPYSPLSLATLPGTTVDATEDPDTDLETMNYWEIRNYTDVTLSESYFWWVYQYDASSPLTFPVIPEGAFAWPNPDGEGHVYDLGGLTASAAAFTGYFDGEEGYAGSASTLRTE